MLFSLHCQLHSGKKQAEHPRQYLLCVRSSEDIHGLEATSLASFPALYWESHLVRVSETGINWRYKSRPGLIVKEITKVLQSLSRWLALFPSPKAWYSWPLEKHKTIMGDLFGLPLWQSFAFLLSSYFESGATRKSCWSWLLGTMPRQEDLIPWGLTSWISCLSTTELASGPKNGVLASAWKIYSGNLAHLWHSVSGDRRADRYPLRKQSTFISIGPWQIEMTEMMGNHSHFYWGKCTVPRWSGASGYEWRLASPLQAQEKRKYNNKYWCFLNLYSSSIAYCKQYYWVCFLFNCRKLVDGWVKSRVKHPSMFPIQLSPRRPVLYSPCAWLMTEADMGLCSESSGRRWLSEINSRETKKEKYQRPTPHLLSLELNEPNKRCSHRLCVLSGYIPPLRRWGYTRMQHGKQLPISQVEPISFQDSHKACSSQTLLAVVGSRPSWPVCQVFSTDLCSFLPLLLSLSVQGRRQHLHTFFFS